MNMTDTLELVCMQYLVLPHVKSAGGKSFWYSTTSFHFTISYIQYFDLF